MDWNIAYKNTPYRHHSRTPCECVDWNIEIGNATEAYKSSHSLWVRGLKSLKLMARMTFTLVALLVSAWIEINKARWKTVGWWESHSLWVRGLKLLLTVWVLMLVFVALLVSAWIEILCLNWYLINFYSRTPCVCVDWNWNNNWFKQNTCKSHSLWVRGLKCLTLIYIAKSSRSHSLWVRGLK